jgi:hypothetical protein
VLDHSAKPRLIMFKKILVPVERAQAVNIIFTLPILVWSADSRDWVSPRLKEKGGEAPMIDSEKRKKKIIPIFQHWERDYQRRCKHI